jgi:hypothetical protein
VFNILLLCRMLGIFGYEPLPGIVVARHDCG